MDKKVRNSKKENVDWDVVNDFGTEWEEFQFDSYDLDILKETWNQYFDIFPWEDIPENAEGFDMGCGSGRWAQFVIPKVGRLNCIDPSSAIHVAESNLNKYDNAFFFKETVEECSLENESQDFGYSLGVLHHIPDTQKAIKDCAIKLKKGAPFLLYLYYDFEDKPALFKFIWKLTNLLRLKVISKLPPKTKKVICGFIAISIYFPFAKFSKLLEILGFNVENIPLSDYRNKSFYIMNNDSLDRFGTKLEQRFSKKDITNMLIDAGFDKVTFSNKTPYWTCISYKS
jgi:SAM-dependent methyltransferase